MRKKRTRVMAGLMACALSIMCVGPCVYAATISDEEEIGPGYETMVEKETESEIGPGYDTGIKTAVIADSVAEGSNDAINAEGSQDTEQAATVEDPSDTNVTAGGTTAASGTSNITEKTLVTAENAAETSAAVTDEEESGGEETENEGDGSGEAMADDENGGYLTLTFGDLEITLGDDTEEVLKGIVDVNSYLNLRTGAGTGYEVIGHLFPGTEVEITGEEGDWYQVTVAEQTGYVCGDYLDLFDTVVTNDISDETVLLMMMLMMMQESMRQPEPEPEPEPEPVEPEVVTASGLTPEGTLTLVDDIGSSTESGQQFITVETKNGNYFYLIIDRDTDGGENVHFLNMVDERDLLDLMNEDEAAEYTSATTYVTEEIPVVVTYEPAETEVADETEDETEETKKSSGGSILLIIVIVLVAAGIGVFFVFKKKQDAENQTKTKPDPDADYGVEDTADAEPDDAYEFPEDDEYGSDDEIPDEEDYEERSLEDDPEDNEEDK